MGDESGRRYMPLKSEKTQNSAAQHCGTEAMAKKKSRRRLNLGKKPTNTQHFTKWHFKNLLTDI